MVRVGKGRSGKRQGRISRDRSSLVALHVKDPSCLVTAVAQVTAVGRVQSLAQECHVSQAWEKKKKMAAEIGGMQPELFAMTTARILF